MQLTRPGSSLGSDMLPTWTSKAAAALSVLGSQTRTALRPFGSTRPLYSRSSSGDLIMSCCLTTTVDMILLDDENEFEKRIEGTRELIFGLTRAPIRDMTSKHLVIQFLTNSRIIIGQYNKKWLAVYDEKKWQTVWPDCGLGQKLPNFAQKLVLSVFPLKEANAKFKNF